MNRVVTSVTSLLLVLVSSVTLVAEPNNGVRFERQGEELFLDCADVARELGWEFKVVRPGSLATFCREAPESICIPIVLKDGNHFGNERPLVRADLLQKSLGFEVKDQGEHVSITARERSVQVGPSEQTPAYNAQWGTARGFDVGQTLPDIPLVDLEGNEVRFGQFLGKRYILYCWASW